jgi:hypothetical protein
MQPSGRLRDRDRQQAPCIDHGKVSGVDLDDRTLPGMQHGAEDPTKLANPRKISASPELDSRHGARVAYIDVKHCRSMRACRTMPLPP